MVLCFYKVFSQGKNQKIRRKLMNKEEIKSQENEEKIRKEAEYEYRL